MSEERGAKGEERNGKSARRRITARSSLFAPRSSVLGGIGGSAAIGALAYRRGSLSRAGVAGAVLVGTAIIAAGGALPAALLLTFFVSSSALSHWRRDRKRAAAAEFAKGERRDVWQVAANGGVAALLALAGRRWPATPWFPALVGALATVNADTWATVVGMLSRRPPRLVTTLRRVPAGTSGGITPLGTLAGLLGAGLVGAVAALAPPSPAPGRYGRSGRFGILGRAIVAGLSGSLADSLLGATLQGRYRCPACGVLTERARHRCGTPTILVGGWRWLNNDAVNLASSALGAATGWFLATRRPR